MRKLLVVVLLACACKTSTRDKRSDADKGRETRDLMELFLTAWVDRTGEIAIEQLDTPGANPMECPSLETLVTYSKTRPPKKQIRTTKDAWGTPLQKRCNEEHVGPFGLSSAGPDRVHGTADDLRTWKPY